MPNAAARCSELVGKMAKYNYDAVYGIRPSLAKKADKNISNKSDQFYKKLEKYDKRKQYGAS